MPTLAELLMKVDRKPLVADCTLLIDEEVAAKSGLGGIAIKGAYATCKAIKPGFIQAVVDGMLDEWIEALEPHYQSWQSTQKGSFGEFLSQRADDVAEDLLAVTDERAAATSHKTVAKLYDKLRPSAKRNVATAVPRLGVLLVKHLEKAGSQGS
jgi:hypothetical protein